MQTDKPDLPSYLEVREVSMVPLICVSGASLAQLCGIAVSTGLSIHGEEQEGPAIQGFGANQSMHREQRLPGTLWVLLQTRSERHKLFLKQHFLLLISSSHQA